MSDEKSGTLELQPTILTSLYEGIELDDTVKKLIHGLPKKWILMLLVNSNKYLAFNVGLIRYLVNDLNLRGVYVTVNKPYNALVEALERQGVRTKNMVFIDAISRSIGEGKESTQGCLFLDGPADLTSIGIAVVEGVALLKDEKNPPFVFLDSLSTLLLYNSQQVIGKFSHFMTARIRLWGVKGVVMSLEDDVRADVMVTIKQFCDQVIIVK